MLEGADVAALRDMLGDALPPGGKVMCEHPTKGTVTLQDSDRVPEVVVLADYRGRRSFYLHFTPRELRTLFRKCKEFFMRPEIQRRLDELEKQAEGREERYNIMLSQLLNDEAWPRILPQMKIDVPIDMHTMDVVREGVKMDTMDLETAMIWLESNWAMRNKAMTAIAYQAVCWLSFCAGADPPDFSSNDEHMGET